MFALNKILHEFNPISLMEMDSVSLMKRSDTKFIIHPSDLKNILTNLRENSDYQILKINNKTLMSYRSLYLDTLDTKFYLDHHNKRMPRTKIRMRKYVDSDLCFLEVKQKNRKGKTTKSRMSIKDFQIELNNDSKDFIKQETKKKYLLKPTLWNSFKRITLVNLSHKERVTVDFNLTFDMVDQNISFSNIAIVELKQEEFKQSSPIVKALKRVNKRPYSISKYCLGMMHLYPELKSNLFKEKLLYINKVSAFK